MKTYKVTIFRDCHAAHNIKLRNLALLEAQSIKKLAEKDYRLVTMKEEKQ